MSMTGIVILNAVLVAMVLVAILGLLASGIVSSMDRLGRRPTRSRRAGRLHRIANMKLTGSGQRAPLSMSLAQIADRPQGG
jgi:hypothetical protein